MGMNLLNKFKKLINKFLGLFPSKTPTGRAEFDVWAQSIIDTYDLPTKDADSIKWALATMIMHTGPTKAYVPKFKFYLMISAGASKQVASVVFREIKDAQDEAARKAKEQQSAEATALQVVSSDGQAQA